MAKPRVNATGSLFYDAQQYDTNKDWRDRPFQD
jgi:hypothetical protein